MKLEKKACIYLYKSEYQDLLYYYLNYQNTDLKNKIITEYKDEYNPLYFTEFEVTQTLILLPKTEIKLRQKFQRAGENIFKW